MGAQKLYGIGHLAQRAEVGEAVIREWEKQGTLPTVGSDRRRFTTAALVRAIAMGAERKRKGTKVTTPVVAPGALAAAEKDRQAIEQALRTGAVEEVTRMEETNNTGNAAWRQVDMERFIPPAAREDVHKRIAARFYADAYRELRNQGASQAEAVWHIAESYKRGANSITQALMRLNVIVRIRGREGDPEQQQLAQPRLNARAPGGGRRQEEGALDDQLAMFKDFREIYRRFTPAFRNLARELVNTEN